MKIYTFLLLSLILVSLSAYGEDPILIAIKKGNPDLVKQEIDARHCKNQPFTFNEKLLYFNFCEEVIMRRRNAIQFPEYKSVPVYYNGMLGYYSQPVYTKAFPTDENPSISLNCILRGITGGLGALFALPYCFPSTTDYNSNVQNQTASIAIASEIVSLVLLASALIEIDANHKSAQEELYENAIVIKHLINGIETI